MINNPFSLLINFIQRLEEEKENVNRETIVDFKIRFLNLETVKVQKEVFTL